MSPILTRILSPGSACAGQPATAFNWIHACAAVCISAIAVTIAGCGSVSGSGAKAAPISVVSSSGATGQVSSLAVASTAKLSMTPINDSLHAGVDWTVTCGGNPVTGSVVNGACGTLSPAHTTDGAATLFTAPSVVPIGTTVTITATLTGNPSQSSSVSLTIVTLPIAVSFINSAPSSLEVNGTAEFLIQVINDPAGAGVFWTATCGSIACGSFNPVTSPTLSGTQYTAPTTVPAGGSVTITATSLTDTTKSASATVPITAPVVVPISVGIAPATFYVQTSGDARSFHLTATVSNDPASAGVDWTVTCGGSKCGTVVSHTASGGTETFFGPATVPPGGTVTITAKSTTDPTKSAFATATVVTTAPIVVTMSSAPPANLAEGSQAPLAATVASDSNNLGVNWTAACGSASCGSFNLSPAHTASGGQIVYTAPASVPAGGAVTITASSPAASSSNPTPSNPAVAVTTIVTKPPSLSFVQSPPAAMAGAAQAPVSAAVANDVAPGGVTWTVQCVNSVAGDCGWIAPYQTASGATAIYTAPPVTAASLVSSGQTSVTIVATSTADSAVSHGSTPITINPATTLSVAFIPSLPSQVQANATVNLAAAVANDLTDAGVDWRVCASGCGFFTIKPAVPAIPATATTPYVPPVPAVTATAVSAWSNGLAIPYTAPSQPPSSGVVAVAASAHADGTRATSGTIAISATASGPALNGTVRAGQQPVVGASVALYAAGTSGYASISTQLTSATSTGKNGSFTVPSGYGCPQPGSQIYLVATGGQVGSNANNPNLALMTALGSCDTLGSGPIVLNEVTTIASVYATAPFAANDALTGNSSYLYLGTSGSNLSGLANAFAAVNNLVDITTGQARYTVPAGNAAVPYTTVNSLADMLNACAATSGGAEGDGSVCGLLFTLTDPLGTGTYGASIAPLDTLQAAFNIAQHPVYNYGYQIDPNPHRLLSLVTPNSPFQPILSTEPNDWSLSLNYTNGGGLTKASTVGSFAADATGNLWITDTTAGSVIEWNAVGAALSPSTGFPAGGGPIAIDANGNVWVSGNGSLSELTSLGAPVPGSPFSGVAGGGGDMAIDAQGNLWIATGAGVAEFNDLGAELSPSDGYTNSGITGVTAVGFDSSNNVWIGSASRASSIAELTNPGGQLIVSSSVQGSMLPQIAADAAGNLWSADTSVGADVNSGGSLCTTAPYGGKGTILTGVCYPDDDNQDSYPNGLSYLKPGGLAFDGAGTVWVASQGGGGGGGGIYPAIAPSILPIVPSSLSSNSPSYLVAQSLSAGPMRLVVDGSGNVWVLLANNTVTEYVGAATPVVAPVALGLKNNKLAAKP